MLLLLGVSLSYSIFRYPASLVSIRENALFNLICSDKSAYQRGRERRGAWAFMIPTRCCV
jgi:hypothetical protein